MTRVGQVNDRQASVTKLNMVIAVGPSIIWATMGKIGDELRRQRWTKFSVPMDQTQYAAHIKALRPKLVSVF
jgi:hypothetical protein